MSSDRESAPLIKKTKPESARQKKNVLKNSLKNNPRNAEDILIEYLPTIESFSESAIEEIASMYVRVKAKPKRNYYVYKAFLTIPTADLNLKIKRAIAKVAFRLLAKGYISNSSVDLPNEVLFLGVSQLLKDYLKLGQYSKRKRYSANTAIFELALERIRACLLNPAEQAKHFECCKLLNQFKPDYIAALLNDAAIKKVITPIAQEHGFFNVACVYFVVPTEHFQPSIASKNLDGFVSILESLPVNKNQPKILAMLICQLVNKIENAYFKSKYEKMLEACLRKLMEILPPNDPLPLSLDMKKRCKGIINNYYFPRNRKKILNISNGGGSLLGKLNEKFAPAPAPASTPVLAPQQKPPQKSRPMFSRKVALQLDQIEEIVSKYHFFVDINPLIKALGAKIQYISPFLKEELCSHVLDENTKQLLKSNGWADYFTTYYEEVRERGRNQRCENAVRKLTEALAAKHAEKKLLIRGKEVDVADSYIDDLVKKAGVKIQALGIQYSQLLLACQLTDEAREFLGKNGFAPRDLIDLNAVPPAVSRADVDAMIDIRARETAAQTGVTPAKVEKEKEEVGAETKPRSLSFGSSSEGE